MSGLCLRLCAALRRAGLGLLLAAPVAQPALADQPAQRIASLGGGVTEIVYALGQQDRLVARDTTSNYPPAALELPDVGYIRRLSPEGVLTVNPDLIIAKEGAGPQEAVDLLKAASVPIVWVPDGYDKEAVLTKIRTVADALDVPEKGQALADEVGSRIDAARAAAAPEGTEDAEKTRVLFILSMTGGQVRVAGRNTAPDGIITMAGGVNAAASFDGWKPITDEALLQSGAELILMMSGAGDPSTTDEQVLSHPAISVTPAGQSGNLLRMDGMMLTGFSVRTAEAVTVLSRALKGAGG